MARGLDILYEDGHLLVVNKPAGVLTIPGRQGGEVALREVLAERLKITSELRLVHRLDRPTSGVLVLAKTFDAQRALSHQFRRREVDKDYLALVRSQPPSPEGLIDAPLAPHPRRRHLMTVPRTGGRPSRTAWKLVERFRHFSLLRCRLLTGRQHQIRVHLNHVGLPLAVDANYGGADALYLSQFKRDYRPTRRGPERPLIDRLTLHAERLAFTHPATGEPLTITAPLPKDFRATLNQLRKYGR